MKRQALLLLCVIAASKPVLAEGGCPHGMTPVNNGQNWTCIPGGNDQAGGQEAQQQPPQPTGWWEKTWGAIAPSPKGGAVGVALGANSKEEAERLALADCESKGGGACEIGMSYRNQCAAMVLGTRKYFTTSAASIDQAERDGIQYCKESDDNCRVYYTACTEPVFHRY